MSRKLVGSSPAHCNGQQCYDLGHAAGQRSTDQDVNDCSTGSHDNPSGQHPADYIRGYKIGYGNTISQAQNDDGTYGNGCRSR
jgi:hypothetical protein